MTMAKRITDDVVRNLDPPEKGNRIIYDTEVSGFGVRVTAAGTRSFVLNYRNSNGHERRLTIGTYGRNEWGVAAARKRAGELRKKIAIGEDPLAEKGDKRQAATVKVLADRYLSDYALKNEKRSVRDDKSMIANIIKPKLGSMKVGAVRFSDIDRLHQNMRKTPYRANRTVALLSKMFSLAIKWDLRSDNPAKGIDRYHEEPRHRFLSQAELKRLFDALGNYPNQTLANVIRVLLLTGARSGEVLNATWGQFDLKNGVWDRPSSHTKQKKHHRVPLSAPVIQILADMYDDAAKSDDYVFPGKHPGKPLKELKSAWKKICKDADITGVRVHDLRHSFASILASTGFSLQMIGALLGHTQPQTTARYAHLFDEPLKEAVEKVGAIAMSSVEGEKYTLEPFRKKDAS